MRITKKNGQLSTQNELHEVKKDEHSPINSIDSYNNNHSKNSNKRDTIHSNKEVNTPKNFDKISDKDNNNRDIKESSKNSSNRGLKSNNDSSNKELEAKVSSNKDNNKGNRDRKLKSNKDNNKGNRKDSRDSIDRELKSNKDTSKNSSIFDRIFGGMRGNEEFEILMREQGEAILRTKSALMYRNKGRMSDNDIESAINMGLYIAFQRFDPSLGYSFTTFFGKVATNEIKMSYRDYKRFNGTYTTSSGYTRVNVSYDVDSDDIINAVNLLTSRKDNTDELCDAKDVLTLVDELLKEDNWFTQIIPFVQLEYMTKDIAKVIGCSQPQVSRVKKRFIKLFYEKYPDLREYIESL